MAGKRLTLLYCGEGVKSLWTRILYKCAIIS